MNAVLTRSRRSIDDIMNQTWAYTDDLSTTISSWWSNLVDTVNSTARGQYCLTLFSVIKSAIVYIGVALLSISIWKVIFLIAWSH